MPIRELSLWEIGRAHGRIGDMLLAFCFLIWFAAGCLKGTFRIVRNRLDFAVMIFLLVYALSLIWADNIGEGVPRLLKLLRNGMLYILIVDYLSTDFPRGYWRFAVCLLVTGLLQSLAFIWSIAEYGGIAALSMLLQTESVQSNNPILNVVRTNQGGGVFLRGAASWLPLCMFIGYGILSGIRRYDFAIGSRILIVIMGALTVLGVSRTAWAGLVSGFGTIWLLATPNITKKHVLKGGVTVLILLSGVWYFNAQNLIMSRIDFESVTTDPAVQDRLEFYRYTLSRVEESPWLGKGVASIDPDALLIVHSLYLQILGEVGIVGSGIFLWIMGLWVRYLLVARRAVWAKRDALNRQIASSVLGASVFFFVSFLAGHDLGGGEPWLLMGITSALFTYERQRSVSRPGRSLLQANLRSARVFGG